MTPIKIFFFFLSYLNQSCLSTVVINLQSFGKALWFPISLKGAFLSPTFWSSNFLSCVIRHLGVTWLLYKTISEVISALMKSPERLLSLPIKPMGQYLGGLSVFLGWVLLAARWWGYAGSGGSIDLFVLLESFIYSCTPATWLKIRNGLETSILYMKLLNLGNAHCYSELMSEITAWDHI